MKKRIDNSSADAARAKMIRRQTNPEEQKKYVDAMLGNKAQIYQNEIERVGIKAKFWENPKGGK